MSHWGFPKLSSYLKGLLIITVVLSRYWSHRIPPLSSIFILPPFLKGDVLSLENKCEKKKIITQSCLSLCNPMDCSPPGSSVQARILEWTAISFSRGSSWPRDQTQLSCITSRFLTVWATREAHRQRQKHAAASPVEQEECWSPEGQAGQRLFSKSFPYGFFLVLELS